ncbi:hypothetical protein [uncultured Victivallis sp.]|uniref:hypothetical protein n=1 Tax=uncultured Victivallis sp. TaxID=354118 RepID=UPI0025E20958|nr:hypothetical protein [uncultured Victivallis sp.]
MKDLGTITIALAVLSVICVLIICFGFLTPLLTEGMPIIECTAKGTVFTVVGTLAVTFAILAGVFKKK